MNTNSVDFFRENEFNNVNGTEIILAAWEIATPGNRGNIIRLAHNIGAGKVLFVNDNPEFSNLKVKKTAGFPFDKIAWEFISHHDFLALEGKEFKLVALETCDGANNIFNVHLPEKAIIIAGNESDGLPDDIIEKAGYKIFIPMPGGCKSMNVSHALAVAGIEWYRQMTHHFMEVNHM
jgi:tRNA G18 (ribose-2'-O)-methylase SpoU